jgi:hypothetical protein
MKLAISPGITQAWAGGLAIDDLDWRQLRQVRDKFDTLGLSGYLADNFLSYEGRFTLSRDAEQRLTGEDADTLHLCRELGLDTLHSTLDLEREIVLAMLAAPRPLRFPNAAEFLSAVAIRRNIVLAGRRTQLAFGTRHAERPVTHWTYDEDRGFTVLPGQPLIEALTLATQPEAGDGRLFSFSCYRASEYVILLGIAQELARVNPPLLAALQRRWETRAIQSGAYHDAFLTEFGSLEAPLPPRWYVPGDRVWFRNPDAASSDASGYEGSWVIYLGNGLFTNFWRREQPFTFADKCVEIYHWRDAAYRDDEGELRIDEAVVAAHVAATRADPVRFAAVVARMARLRDGRGVYAEGGCIDASREFPRRVCAGTADISLPA